MVVAELMTPNPVTLTPRATLAQVERTLFELDVRHVPIVSDGSLVGIVSDRDIAPFRPAPRGDASGPILASRIMSSDVVTVTPETDLREAIDHMLSHRVGALPVVDESTRSLVGIISYIDVLRGIGKALS